MDQSQCTPTFVREHLLECYQTMVGYEPEGGSFTPEFDLIESILLVADKIYEGDFRTFLQDSMVAFLQRNGGGVGKHPTVKFFVNSYLCSESAISYLRHNRADIDHLYRSATSSETFDGLLRAEIMAGETLFLEGPITAEAPDPGSFVPPVWWMLACVLMKRYSRTEIRREDWLKGNAQSLAEAGRFVPRETLLAHEETRLTHEKRLRDKVIELATDAIQEATYAWLQQHRLVTLYRDEMQVVQMNGQPSLIEGLKDIVRPSRHATLAKRDAAMRDTVVAHLESQGTVVRRRAPSSVMAEETEATPQREYPQLQLVNAWFSKPTNQKLTSEQDS